MGGSNGKSHFTVSIPGELRERIRRASKTASDRSAFLIDLKQVNRLLREKPLDWGDPVRDYHNLQLKILRGLSRFFIIHYAVHLPRRVVLVRDVVFRTESN